MKVPRLVALSLAIAVIGGVAAGIGALVRSHEVDEQRSTSKAHAAVARTKARLDRDDACALAIDWYQSGKGLAGRRPFVTCRGPLLEVAGGYRLENVRTQSDFLQGSIGHGLCLVRPAEGWAVLGEAYQYRECEALLPSGSSVAEAEAAALEAVVEIVEATRRHVRAGLERQRPSGGCPAVSLTRDALVTLDEARLGADDGSVGGVVTHDSTFRTCGREAKGVEPGLVAFMCRRPPSWTHALALRVRVDTPVQVDDEHYGGGTIDGEAWLIELKTEQPLCVLPVKVALPERVLGRRGEVMSEAQRQFAKAAADHVEALVERFVH